MAISSYFSSTQNVGELTLKRAMLQKVRRDRIGVSTPGTFVDLQKVSIQSIKLESVTCIQKWLDSVENLLVSLEDSGSSDQEIQKAREELPQPLQEMLEGDLREMLLWVNEQGNNRLEEVIECLYAVRTSTTGEAELASQVKARMSSPFDIKTSASTLDAVYNELAKLSPEEIGNIMDERLRTAIVKYILKTDTSGLIHPFRANKILVYNIKDQDVLVDVVKFVARRDPSVSEYIKDYEIKDERARIEIAKLAAQQSGAGVSQFIKSYGITDESERIEIAKLAAQQSARGVSSCIKKYEITDESARIEIAKLAAQHDGVWVYYNIQKYEITNPVALLTIKALCLLQIMATQSPEACVSMLAKIRNILIAKWGDLKDAALVKKLLGLDDQGYSELIATIRRPEEVRAFIPLLYLTWL